MQLMMKKKLAKELYNDDSIRLVGVSLSNLVYTNNRQLSIYDKDEEMEKIIDNFGNINHKNP